MGVDPKFSKGDRIMKDLLKIVDNTPGECGPCQSTWTGYRIASAEVPEERRVDLDTTIAAMALTAKEMNSKYKETSEGGLAVSVVLC